MNTTARYLPLKTSTTCLTQNPVHTQRCQTSKSNFWKTQPTKIIWSRQQTLHERRTVSKATLMYKIMSVLLDFTPTEGTLTATSRLASQRTTQQAPPTSPEDQHTPTLILAISHPDCGIGSPTQCPHSIPNSSWDMGKKTIPRSRHFKNLEKEHCF